jgi:hypothetical protein
MTKAQRVLEAVPEQYRSYVAKNLNRSALLRRHNGDILAAATHAATTARQMTDIDHTQDALYSRLAAGVSPSLDMRTGEWIG